MSSAIQIKMLEDIAQNAARSIRDVIAVQDIPPSAAKVLDLIASHLQSAGRDAASYARRYEQVERSVPASEPEHSHVGPNL